MIRIGIVNDLALAVESLRRAVATIPGASVAWVAKDGAQAVARCSEDRPDIVLMDMIMPVMDGVEATRRIMAATPCPILVVTATIEGNAGRVFEALGAGALDAVTTPGLSADGGVVNAAPLAQKVHAIRVITGLGSGPEPVHPAPAPPAARTSAVPPLVALGASTGGPLALAVILKSWAPPAPWPVVVVQHVDEQFAPGLASWLAKETGHRVEIVAAGAAPAPGRVLIPATADHVQFGRDGVLRYSAEPLDVVYRPSVDVFFDSLAAAGASGVAVVLTGMGRDGAAGMARLRAAGWHTIAQDRATSVVWGMPGACAEIGAAAETLPLTRIGPAVASRMACLGAPASGPPPRTPRSPP